MASNGPARMSLPHFPVAVNIPVAVQYNLSTQGQVAELVDLPRIAMVLELVDKLVSKTSGHKSPCGFDSHPWHNCRQGGRAGLKNL